MSSLQPLQVDTSDFLFDFSAGGKQSFSHAPVPGRRYQCIIPTPVFHHESPLFGYSGPHDTAYGPTEHADLPGSSRAELERHSARPYSARVADPEDFAHVYERMIVPVVIDILQSNCDCDFSIDVHNFPELSSDSVPRVIYITLPIPATVELRELVRDAIARRLPQRFHRTHLKFRHGSVKKSTWWGADEKHTDPVCQAQNGGFHPSPRMGISVGPYCSEEDGGSVGGYLKVGELLYGVSCRHVFQKALSEADMRVVHPAHGDHRANLEHDPHTKQSTMGNILLCSKRDPQTERDVTRSSLTFDGTGVSGNHNRVAMDWCIFGPVPKGRNSLHVPTYDMNRLVTVEDTAMIEGNTEVYSVARTSGYSLGYTCDVPGVQRLEGALRREWTVRQYSPSSWDPSTHLEPPWQCVKRWVTSGIGVPGDSGAWLMRRSDNAVVGLIWARNHNHGTPVERIRLTYVTPIVDVLADIRERRTDDVALPKYKASDVRYDPLEADIFGPTLGVGHSAEPWSPFSMHDLRERRGEEHLVIESGLFDGIEPPLCPGPLCFPRSTTAQQGSQAYGDGSDASLSVQVSPDMSDSVQSASPLSASATMHLMERTLLGIGVIAVLQPRQLEIAPPELEADLSSNSIMSSELLDELDSFASNASVRIADNEVTEDEQQIADGADPVRSKAIFAPARARPVNTHRPMLVA